MIYSDSGCSISSVSLPACFPNPLRNPSMCSCKSEWTGFQRGSRITSTPSRRASFAAGTKSESPATRTMVFACFLRVSDAISMPAMHHRRNIDTARHTDWQIHIVYSGAPDDSKSVDRLSDQPEQGLYDPHPVALKAVFSIKTAIDKNCDTPHSQFSKKKSPKG